MQTDVIHWDHNTGRSFILNFSVLKVLFVGINRGVYIAANSTNVHGLRLLPLQKKKKKNPNPQKVKHNAAFYLIQTSEGLFSF